MRSRCQSSFSASVVFVCFRVSRPPSLVRLWLTYPPSVLRLPPDPRVFSRWLPGRPFQTPGCSSLALRRHPSVFALSSPLMTTDSRRLGSPLHKPLAGTSRPFSMSGPRNPSSHFSRSVPGTLPCPWKVPPAGFGYPLDGVSSLDPWQPLSAPNALGLRPSKLSSHTSIEMWSPTSLPLRRFPIKPRQLDTHASAASSQGMSRVPLRPRRFSSGRDRMLPWAF